MKKYLILGSLCCIGLVSRAQTSTTSTTPVKSSQAEGRSTAGVHTNSGTMSNVHTNDGKVGGIATSNPAGAPMSRTAGSQEALIQERNATPKGRAINKSEGVNAASSSTTVKKPSSAKGTVQ